MLSKSYQLFELYLKYMDSSKFPDKYNYIELPEHNFKVVNAKYRLEPYYMGRSMWNFEGNDPQYPKDLIRNFPKIMKRLSDYGFVNYEEFKKEYDNIFSGLAG